MYIFFWLCLSHSAVIPSFLNTQNVGLSAVKTAIAQYFFLQFNGILEILATLETPSNSLTSSAGGPWGLERFGWKLNKETTVHWKIVVDNFK